ncbi:MAG: hypothetical protein J1F38_03840 [Muribaculaceae bacterium]|nr:hypothetical protein [Muribaculaceae bacterium]
MESKILKNITLLVCLLLSSSNINAFKNINKELSDTLEIKDYRKWENGFETKTYVCQFSNDFETINGIKPVSYYYSIEWPIEIIAADQITVDQIKQAIISRLFQYGEKEILNESLVFNSPEIIPPVEAAKLRTNYFQSFNNNFYSGPLKDNLSIKISKSPTEIIVHSSETISSTNFASPQSFSSSQTFPLP